MAHQALATPSLNCGSKTIGLSLYTPDRKQDWNDFVARSKNGVFLFQRDYMDYHADRFADHSLLAYEGDRLLALFPANLRADALVSHGGLTFGGFITDERMRTPVMLELFDQLRQYAQSNGMRRIVYKPVPHIYHRAPAEEDLYALFRQDAKLIRRDVSSTVVQAHRLNLTKGRKWSIKKAKSGGLDVRRSDDFETFMEMERLRLDEKYGVSPTHSPAEMRLLANRFPEQIKLYAAYRQEAMLAGAIVYESPCVAHTQYLASTEEGRAAAALDAVLDMLLNVTYAATPYFDFGIS